MRFLFRSGILLQVHLKTGTWAWEQEAELGTLVLCHQGGKRRGPSLPWWLWRFCSAGIQMLRDWTNRKEMRELSSQITWYLFQNRFIIEICKTNGFLSRERRHFPPRKCITRHPICLENGLSFSFKYVCFYILVKCLKIFIWKLAKTSAICRVLYNVQRAFIDNVCLFWCSW